MTEWKINSYASTEDETFTKEYKDLTEDEKTQLVKEHVSNTPGSLGSKLNEIKRGLTAVWTEFRLAATISWTVVGSSGTNKNHTDTWGNCGKFEDWFFHFH